MNTTVKFVIISSKVNIVADALNRKERVKPIHARVMSMATHPGIYAKVLEAQSEAFEDTNVQHERLRWLDKQMNERKTARCIS